MCHNVNVLRTIQSEIGEWSRRNFGIQASKWPGFTIAERDEKLPIPETIMLPGEQFDSIANGTIILHHVAPLLGMVEETGELVAAFVKWDKEAIRDAIGDIFIYFLDYCSRTVTAQDNNPSALPRGGDVITIHIFNCVNWDALNKPVPPQQLSAFPVNTMMIALGQIIHCNLKRHQGIRGYDGNQKFLSEVGAALTLYFQSIRDIYRTSHPHSGGANQPGNLEPSFMDHREAFNSITVIAASTWNQVKTRDWNKNPANAASIAEAAVPDGSRNSKPTSDKMDRYPTY
jgi:hypothetical protein